MRTALGALALLLAVAGCSADDEPAAGPGPAPTSEAATADAGAPPRPARPRLRAAQLALARATAGAYTLRIDTSYSDTTITERGLFDVAAEVLNVRRTIRLGPGEGDRRLVLRIRSSPATRYLQVDDWGGWDGCWAEFDPELLAEQGIDLRGFPNIPVPVSLVLDARLSPENITPTSGPMVDRATVLTDGFTALQLLGVDAAALLELPATVARVRVPAHLTYFADHPDVVRTIELFGSEVSDAFREGKARTPEKLRSHLRYRDATVTFSPAPGPVRFERPPARTLLPPRARPEQTCAAYRGPGGPAAV